MYEQDIYVDLLTYLIIIHMKKNVKQLNPIECNITKHKP